MQIRNSQVGVGKALPSSRTLTKAALGGAIGLSTAALATGAVAAEMTCTPIPNSEALLCLPSKGAAAATAAAAPATTATGHAQTTMGRAADSVSSFFSSLGPVGHAAAIGATVTGGLGALFGLAIGGIPDNARNPIAGALFFGIPAAVVGGVAGAAVGAVGLMF